LAHGRRCLRAQSTRYMPTPDKEMLSPGLERRLKAALDEVVPPSPTLSSARYRMGVARQWSRAWRFAPALVAIAAAGAALTATAATGSPNPSVWRDRAGTVIQNVGHLPSPTRAAKSPKPAARQTPEDKATEPSRPTPSSNQEPKESPEPSDKPGPSERPEPTPPPGSDGGDDSSGGGNPSPTPPDGGGD
jgi:outer membrane biosynthesis protein TonB